MKSHAVDLARKHFSKYPKKSALAASVLAAIASMAPSASAQSILVNGATISAGTYVAGYTLDNGTPQNFSVSGAILASSLTGVQINATLGTLTNSGTISGTHYA